MSNIDNGRAAPPSDTFAILLGGDVWPGPRLLDQVAGRRVIAADAGMRHAIPLGVTPELWIGDFDSADATLLASHAAVPRETHPRAKDISDGALALEAALARGARDVLLVGAMEGRSDHAIAHLLQLADLASRGIVAMASSGREEAIGLAPGRHHVELPPGTLFSLIGFEPLRRVVLRGARWSLSGEDIPFASTRPLSNVAEGPLEIDIGAGRGVLLARLGET